MQEHFGGAMKPALRQPPPAPRPSWWIQPMSPEQWYATAAERAKELNAVSTTQHVQRRDGDK